MNNNNFRKDLDNISRSSKLTQSMVDTTGIKSAADLSQSIALNINRVSDSNKGIGGESIVSLLLKNEKETKKAKTVSNKTMFKLNDLINKNGQFTSMVNDVFFSENETFSLYQDYATITALIPEISLILSTYYENIISPDSLSANNLHVSYSDTTDESTSRSIELEIKSIIADNKIEKKFNQAIKDFLCYGKGYVAVLNFTDALNMVLKESSDHSSHLYDHSLYENFNKLVEGSNTFKSIATANQILTESSEEIQFLTELTYGEKTADSKKDEVAKNIETIGKSLLTFQSFDEFIKTKKDSKHTSSNDENPVFHDIHVMHIDPSKIIPVKTDSGDPLGYFYIEYDLTNTIGTYKTSSRSGTASFAMNQLITNNASSVGTFEDMVDSKKRVISEIFTKMLGKKINSNFVANNYQFKEVIYNLLKNEDNINRQYKITFLPPECVTEVGEGHDSVLKNILFASKMYLACTLSNFMQRIVQGPEKRMFYVDVGLDKDIPGAVTNFAKSIKSQEFNLENLKDINTSLRKIGTHQDLFIPTQDGQKRIDTEIMPSKEIAYNDDFLDFLKKAIINGSAIPSSYLGIQEDVDFAKSLTMNNRRFAQRIIEKNNETNRGAKDFINKCIGQKTKYMVATEDAEGVNGATTTTTSNLFTTDMSKLEVGYPKPQSLIIDGYSDRLRGVKEYTDFVVETFYSQDDSNGNEAREFRLGLTRKLLPDVDWDDLRQLKEEVARKIKLDKLKTGDTEEEESSY